MEKKITYHSPDVQPARLNPSDFICISGTIEDIRDMDEFEW